MEGGDELVTGGEVGNDEMLGNIVGMLVGSVETLGRKMAAKKGVMMEQRKGSMRAVTMERKRVD